MNATIRIVTGKASYQVYMILPSIKMRDSDMQASKLDNFLLSYLIKIMKKEIYVPILTNKYTFFFFP